MRRCWNDAASATSVARRRFRSPPLEIKHKMPFRIKRHPGERAGKFIQTLCYRPTVHDDSFTHPLDGFDIFVVEFSQGLKLSTSLREYQLTS